MEPRARVVRIGPMTSSTRMVPAELRLWLLLGRWSSPTKITVLFSAAFVFMTAGILRDHSSPALDVVRDDVRDIWVGHFIDDRGVDHRIRAPVGTHRDARPSMVTFRPKDPSGTAELTANPVERDQLVISCVLHLIALILIAKQLSKGRRSIRVLRIGVPIGDHGTVLHDPGEPTDIIALSSLPGSPIVHDREVALRERIALGYLIAPGIAATAVVAGVIRYVMP